MMPTYAENAAARERAERKRAQDQHMAGLHAGFDRQTAEATDKRGNHKTMKYERPSFIVVTASKAYRRGWEEIFGEKNTEPGPQYPGEIEEHPRVSSP